MPLDKPTRTTRGNFTRIELPDKTIISVPPVNIEQVRRCIRLDPDKDQVETDREYIERVAEQFTILVGPEHAHLTSKLTLDAVQQIVRVLYVAGCGMDAEAYSRWQIEERKLAYRRDALETLTEIDAATVNLAAQLSLRPADVAAMSLADCAAARQEIAKLTNEQQKFQVLLHGHKI